MLASSYLLWGVLFALKQSLSIYIYWIALAIGFIIDTQSEYFFVFSILVFPVTVYCSAGIHNIVNLSILLLGIRGDLEGATPFTQIFLIFFITSIIYFLPLNFRLYQEKIIRVKREREASEKKAQEDLRALGQELARELHDGLARHISALQLQASKALMTQDLDLKDKTLETIGNEAREALASLRIMMRTLRQEEDLTQKPEQPSSNVDLQETINNFKKVLALEGFTCSPVIYNLDNIPQPLAPTISRMLTELSTNIIRYGDPARPVALLLSSNIGNLQLKVSNYKGDISPKGTGYGLRGIEEQIKALNGTYTSQIKDNLWVVDLRIPL